MKPKLVVKFKDRYILGEGYSWAIGTGPYKEITLCRNPKISPYVDLEWPQELWNPELPKYRLVLEKVKP